LSCEILRSRDRACNKFLYNKTNQVHQFPKFTPAWNSTCFGQFLFPSSGFIHCTLGTGICHTGLKTVFEQDRNGTAVPSWSCLKALYKPVWYIPLLSVQWINSWWWAEELPETWRVSCRSKFGKLVHLVGFIIKKSPVKFRPKIHRNLLLCPQTPRKGRIATRTLLATLLEVHYETW